MKRIKLVVDGAVFQLGRSGIARIWATVLPMLPKRHPIDLLFLDRGNGPTFPGIERIPFPSRCDKHNAQDSSLLENICEERSADIFLSTYYTTPLCTPSLAVVYDSIPERLGWDLHERLWQERELTISHGRRHLCISERTCADLLEFRPELDRRTVEVAHCGVDHTIFSRSSAIDQKLMRRRLGLERPFYILVGVGSSDRAYSYKNWRLFFEAVSSLQRIDFDVLWVGGSSELVGAEVRPERCRVVCVELDDRDLAAGYGAAAALIYPSLYEGFGFPVIEAMACGCPVVTTNFGALPETAGSAAYKIDGSSIAGMIEALWVVRDLKSREMLIRAGECQSQKFCWNDFVDALGRNIQTIVEESKAGRFGTFYDRWRELRLLQRDVDSEL